MIAATLMVKIAADTTAFDSALSKAQRAVRGSAQQMQQASTAVTALQTRMDSLTKAFRLGAISEAQWAAQMRTVIADAKELAATTDMTAKSTDRLTRAIASSERQLRAAGTAAKRSVDGLEGVATAANGMAMAATMGAQGIAAATGSLQQLAISMKMVSAVGWIGAIGAIAQVFVTLGRAIKDAGAETKKLSDKMSFLFQETRGVLLAMQQVTQAQIAAAPRPRAMSPAEVAMRVATGSMLSSPEQRNLDSLNATLRTINRALAVTSVSGHDAAAGVAHVGNSASRAASQMRELSDAIFSMPAIGGAMERAVGGPGATISSKASSGKGNIDPASAAFKDTLNAVQPVIDLTNAVAGAVSNMANAIGTGLATGANLFKTFAKSAIAAIGSIISAIGQMLIAKGIGDIVKSLPFAGPAAIAIGAGLVTLGAAMGGGNGRSAPGGGGGSFASSAPASAGSGHAPVQIIQFVTADGREVSRHVVETNARQVRLGAPTRVPLNAVVIAGPVAGRG